MLKEDLNQYRFSSYAGFNAQLIRWRYEELQQHFWGRTCLELGSADGQGTEFLAAHFDHVVAVDGSSEAIHALTERFLNGNVTAVQSYFEDLALETKFDTVVLAHILEHVEDPHETLLIAARFLAPGGVIIVDVPNGLSLHRQLGVEMGLLEQPTQLNAADLSIGHKRVYVPDTFRAEIASAGLVVEEFGGIFLKVLSNSQIESAFDTAQQRAFLAIGKRYPDLASEIYVVAKPSEGL